MFQAVVTCFSPYLSIRSGGGGGFSQGIGTHNLLMQLFALDGSKIEVFEICSEYCDHTI